MTDQARSVPGTVKKHQTYEDSHAFLRTFHCPRKDDLTLIVTRVQFMSAPVHLRHNGVRVCRCACGVQMSTSVATIHTYATRQQNVLIQSAATSASVHTVTSSPTRGV